MSKITDWILEQEANGEIVFNEKENLYEPRNKARCEHGCTFPRTANGNNTIRSDVSEGRGGYSRYSRRGSQTFERRKKRLQTLARSIWGRKRKGILHW